MSSATVVEVIRETTVIEVVAQPTHVVEVIAAGPRGPAGPAGASGSGEVHVQETPLATWTFSHTLGRRPVPSVYIDGELVIVGATADDTTISIQFARPEAGELVLT